MLPLKRALARIFIAIIWLPVFTILWVFELLFVPCKIENKIPNYVIMPSTWPQMRKRKWEDRSMYRFNEWCKRVICL